MKMFSYLCIMFRLDIKEICDIYSLLWPGINFTSHWFLHVFANDRNMEQGSDTFDTLPMNSIIQYHTIYFLAAEYYVHMFSSDAGVQLPFPQISQRSRNSMLVSFPTPSTHIFGHFITNRFDQRTFRITKQKSRVFANSTTRPKNALSFKFQLKCNSRRYTASQSRYSQIQNLFQFK